MFNNNLRKMVASAMLLTVITGTSLAIKVPTHAQKPYLLSCTIICGPKPNK